jgi:hypothetical protein
VTLISIHSIIIYVVFFGACMRCTWFCPFKSGCDTDGAPKPNERRFPRACERRRSRGLAAVAHRGGQPAATLLWRAGKHRRSRTGPATVAHPRPGGDGGCTRRGRLRQQRRWILEERTRQRIPEPRAVEWCPLAPPSRDDVVLP